MPPGSPYVKIGTDGADLGWSGVATPPIPPPPNPPPITDGEAPVVTTFTVARASGINYRVNVDVSDNVGVYRVDLFVEDVHKVMLTAPTSGTVYTEYVKIPKKGSSEVRVVAYDAAGNKAEITRTVVR